MDNCVAGLKSASAGGRQLSRITLGGIVHRYSVDYGFDDYLSSSYGDGYFDPEAQLEVIVPLRDVHERDGFLIIGRAGVDGIEFGYRRGELGIFAYYPSEDEYVSVADGVQDLIQRWHSGTLVL